MLHKTKAIVLKTTKYAETSIVAQLYTEKFGMQTYIINSVRSAKAKTKISLLQPLSLLEMVVYHSDRKNIQRTSEIKPAYIFKSIPFDIAKSSVAVFLTEILFRSIREQEENHKLFDFIFSSIIYFDERNNSYANFHLSFLLKLSGYLGFAPNGKFSEKENFFDLQHGKFIETEPSHLNYLKKPLSKYFSDFANADVEQAEKMLLNRNQRKLILEKILLYYSLHLDNFKNILSPKILEDVFA